MSILPTTWYELELECVSSIATPARMYDTAAIDNRHHAMEIRKFARGVAFQWLFDGFVPSNSNVV